MKTIAVVDELLRLKIVLKVNLLLIILWPETSGSGVGRDRKCDGEHPGIPRPCPGWGRRRSQLAPPPWSYTSSAGSAGTCKSMQKGENFLADLVRCTFCTKLQKICSHNKSRDNNNKFYSKSRLFSKRNCSYMLDSETEMRFRLILYVHRYHQALHGSRSNK